MRRIEKGAGRSPPFRALRVAVRKLLMQTRIGRRVWWRGRGVPHEIGFWSSWFEQKGGRWADDYARRTGSEIVIEDPLVVDALAARERTSISIIDVGAGPITQLGTSYPGKEVTVTPVDPLADHYDELLTRFRINPPVRTLKCAGEDLLARFPAESFDIAYAVNSVDHSHDPMAIIRNMLGVVKRDGLVVLRHARNEGEYERYVGLHQWNFDVVDGRLVLWNNAVRHDVTDALRGRARVDAWLESREVLARLEPQSS
jgi:SAM-dependent methyltransferase